jgi:hypothetical protein
MIPKEKALLVNRWQSLQWHVDQLWSFGDLVSNIPALAAAGLRKLHGNASRRLQNLMSR